MLRPLRLQHLLIAGISAAAFALLGAGDAFACTCAKQPAKQRLKQSDAAAEVEVVGVRHREPEQAGLLGGYEIKDTILTLKLLAVHKGPRRLRDAKTVKVRTGGIGDSCALHPNVGWRSGLFLAKVGRHWRTSICQVIGRKALRRAADEKRRPQRSSRSRSATCTKE